MLFEEIPHKPRWFAINAVNSHFFGILGGHLLNLYLNDKTLNLIIKQEFAGIIYLHMRGYDDNIIYFVEETDYAMALLISK